MRTYLRCCCRTLPKFDDSKITHEDRRTLEADASRKAPHSDPEEQLAAFLRTALSLSADFGAWKANSKRCTMCYMTRRKHGRYSLLLGRKSGRVVSLSTLYSRRSCAPINDSKTRQMGNGSSSTTPRRSCPKARYNDGGETQGARVLRDVSAR